MCVHFTFCSVPQIPPKNNAVIVRHIRDRISVSGDLFHRKAFNWNRALCTFSTPPVHKKFVNVTKTVKFVPAVMSMIRSVFRTRVNEVARLESSVLNWRLELSPIVNASPFERRAAVCVSEKERERK
jgi:hypothetical protein